MGGISISKKGNMAQYSVNSPKELLKVEEHLTLYPLLTQKQADFILFKQVLKLIRNKEHLTLSGLNEIVACKASMNKGLLGSLKDLFADIIPKDRPFISNSDKITSE